jgi:hypothetical protein
VSDCRLTPNGYLFDGETVDVDVHRVLRLCADASLTGISLLNQDNERPEASTSEYCDTPGSCKYGGLTHAVLVIGLYELLGNYLTH